jgi:hypothetical protein
MARRVDRIPNHHRGGKLTKLSGCPTNFCRVPADRIAAHSETYALHLVIFWSVIWQDLLYWFLVCSQSRKPIGFPMLSECSQSRAKA